jgi:hypothetical protein
MPSLLTPEKLISPRAAGIRRSKVPAHATTQDVGEDEYHTLSSGNAETPPQEKEHDLLHAIEEKGKEFKQVFNKNRLKLKGKLFQK